MHHRQSKPGTLAGAFGGEERFRRTLQRRLVHADTGVLHGEPDIIALDQFSWMLSARSQRSPDCQLATQWHRIPGIEREVQQRQFKLIGISLNRSEEHTSELQSQS